MRNVRVLIVDDETDFAEVVARRLNRRGLTALVAPGGEEALAWLARDPAVDVVVLDVKMPGMDGIDTLRAIRASHPAVQVLLLTGHATEETAAEGMRLGAWDYLLKPVDLDDLLAKLQEVAAKRAEHAAANPEEG